MIPKKCFAVDEAIKGKKYAAGIILGERERARHQAKGLKKLDFAQIDENEHKTIAYVYKEGKAYSMNDRDQIAVLEQLTKEDNGFVDFVIEDEVVEPLPASVARQLSLAVKAKETKGECSVCCERIPAGALSGELPCKHIFHAECLEPWFAKSHSCPNCRLDLIAHFSERR
eukprot:TRINITY_DN3386_c0_g1_i14.p1 TRINITY_DN3386_c0_g1~~TRINITY_DN3386_c0_g1_i14.p1  ORF type:complete len:171 (-),score=17.63 TRINITY_DN3386_c0_g1_i14:118-630(-)